LKAKVSMLESQLSQGIPAPGIEPNQPGKTTPRIRTPSQPSVFSPNPAGLLAELKNRKSDSSTTSPSDALTPSILEGILHRFT
jgi:hypothetical protein